MFVTEVEMSTIISIDHFVFHIDDGVMAIVMLLLYVINSNLIILSNSERKTAINNFQDKQIMEIVSIDKLPLCKII